MIERVAKAIAAQAHEPDSEYWLPYARAALEAMREPSTEMEAVGQAVYMVGVNYVAGVAEAGDEAAYQLYRLMIDAALSPAQPVKEK